MTLDASPYFLSAQRVAFTGIRTTTIPQVSSDTVITYDIKDVDEGGAFNHLTGTFTAKVAGIYYFSFHGRQDQYDTVWTSMFLCHNGALVCTAMGRSGSNSMIGNSATVRMEIGDMVDVVVQKGFFIFSDSGKYITFSGFLVITK